MKKISQLIAKSNAASRKAIQSFLTTEETLKKENDELLDTLRMIDEESERLAELRRNGRELFEENAGIITRIGEIVRGKDGR